MYASGMLTVESYNVFLKHWAKSRKNVGEGISRLNALCQETWLGGLTIDSLRPPATLSKTHTHTFVGRGRDVVLNDMESFAGAVSLVADRWPGRVPAVAARLLTAYRNRVFVAEPLAFTGVEDGGPRLSHAEQEDLLRAMTWKEFDVVEIRGVIFKSRKARVTAHDNTGIMFPYRGNDGSERTMYGELRRLFCLPEDGFPDPPGRPGAELPPLLDVEWLVPNGAALHGGRMPQVMRDIGNRNQWNRERRFQLGDIIHAWNVVFWPLKLSNARSPGEALVAIFRQGKRRATDRHTQ